MTTSQKIPLDLGQLVIPSDYDWADQRGARAAHVPQPTRRADDDAGPRLARLIVIRESDVYDRALFDGALRQSWARNSDAPHLEQIRAAGLDPLYHPEKCPFQVVNIGGERFRAAFFVLGGFGWVYSPGSANLTNSRGDNEFTATLSALIVARRPVVLDAVAFARLVRSLEHGPGLGAVCAQHVDLVLAGPYRLDFKDHRELAQLLWVVLSAMAAGERDEIQRRHTAGVLVKYTRGEWLIQKDQVPFGYRFRPGTKILEPDPTKRPVVQDMLRILVSGLPDSMQVEQFLTLGVLHSRPANAHSALRTLIRWSVLYVNGKWIQHYANPMAGLTEWMGVPVIRAHPEDRGHFELTYDPGLPPGGWAEESLLSEVLALVRATQQPRVGGKRSRHGLVGFRWEGPIGSRTGRRQWRQGIDHGRFDIRVRPRR